MKFEWDENKAKSNLRKHGVSFSEAATVFSDTFSAGFSDPDHSIAENRWIVIGRSDSGRLIVVCYAERSGAIRIISTRKATKREIRNYES